MVIANLAVFFSYFANLYLFDKSENLPILQVILAILFFAIISQFLLAKSPSAKEIKINKQSIKKLKTKKLKFNKYALYPIGTALCR
jgi:hypothetical protein